jgi:predicted ribosomally synthesized peptide with nif11-like leader
MSEEQLKAFLEKVKADTSLQEQLKAEGADPVAIAKAAGFAITIEDLKEHRQNKLELSDDELEGIAGGVGRQFPSINGPGCNPAQNAIPHTMYTCNPGDYLKLI